MTAETFIKDMEGYYQDSYGEAGRRILGQYLDGFSETLLPYLFSQVLKTHDRTRGRIAPGVAEMEKARKDAFGAMTAARAAIAAKAPTLQIGEDILAPEKVAELGDILRDLSASKSLDAEGGRV